MKAHWMLRLYPRAWRNRYEDEFRALLDDYPTTTGDLFDILLGAADAQLQFSQLPARATDTEGQQLMAHEIRYQQVRLRVRWLAALYLNVALFFFVNVLLVGINLLTNPDTLWFVYPLWGWSMLLIAHAATVVRGRRLFGAHATLFAVLNAGLLWINLSTTDVYWFQWPLINTAILLLAHTLVAFNITGYFGAHVTVSVLAIGQLGYIAAAGLADVPGTNESNTWVLWAITSVLTLVLFHALLRFRNVTWLAAHAVLFVVFNIQFALQDFTQSDERWFYYPLVAWAVVLAAHVGVKSGLLPSFDADWQMRKQQELMQRAALEPVANDDSADLTEAYGRRAGELRVLNMLLFTYLLFAVVLALMNVLTWSSTAWALWPLWGWGIVLGAHAGYIHFRRSLLGAHVALYVFVNAGLLTIDLLFSDSRWFFWPLAGSNLVLLLHIALSRESRRAVRAWEQRRIASMLE